jgi:hypothetical protein
LGQRRDRKNLKTLDREDAFLVHPKTASTALSSTGALVAAGSLEPMGPGWAPPMYDMGVPICSGMMCTQPSVPYNTVLPSRTRQKAVTMENRSSVG